MTEEYKIRLGASGIDSNKPITFILEDLLSLAEFLYEESEKSEMERFQDELNRNLRPTN